MGKGEHRVSWDKEEETLPAVKLVQVRARMPSALASLEDSSEKNPKGRHLKVTLLNIFQICVSLTGIFRHPTGTGTARSYIGQRRDRVRTL